LEDMNILEFEQAIAELNLEIGKLRTAAQR
jgi:hypothetical protein